MSKQLMINPEKCVGCKTCEIACAYNRGKNFEPQSSAVSVQIFQDASICVPVMCLQCEEACCVSICPVGAMSRDDSGVVKCDTDKCIGCKMCVNACPLGNVSFSGRLRKVVKCELCGGSPLCAKFCPVDAIVYTDKADGLGRKKAVATALKEIFTEEKKAATAI